MGEESKEEDEEMTYDPDLPFRTCEICFNEVNDFDIFQINS